MMPSPAFGPGASPRPITRRPQLSREQEQIIHAAACEIMAAAIQRRAERLPDPLLGGTANLSVMGAFVTLKREGRLRACCGVLGQIMPLNAALRQAATRTATEDTRFPTISQTELPFLNVDVSLLHEFRVIESSGTSRADAVEVGRHGLQIRRGPAAGLLLPGVATEHGYGSEEFLRQVCLKAGLPTTAWEDESSEIQTFETYAIAGLFAEAASSAVPEAAPLLTSAEVQALSQHCAQNLAALVRGATPSYYAPNCPDGTANAVTLSLLNAPPAEAAHFFRLSLRPGMPLQATLFSLTEAVASAVRSGTGQVPDGPLQIAISVLSDPAMHGTAAEPDLRGIDTTRRAMMVHEGSRSAWCFRAGATPEQLLDETVRSAGIENRAAAGVLTFAACTSQSPMAVSNSPRAVAGPAMRPAAVAGRFYPADPAALSRLVDSFLSSETAPTQDWPAVMVPHAGLQYSGRVAAAVLQRVTLPDTAIILCPKHTRFGVDWAVAPHEQWAIPGATVAGDAALARRVAEAVRGAELDAAAHRQEHAVEVQLPLLSRIAPAMRIVAITIGGAADYEHCCEFAADLAKVVRELPSHPLLVISSDLNHYAPDAENRRLDELALAAIERLNPAAAYRTITEHGVSMCGLRPAIIVMETLRQLGGLSRAERVAYATSADTTGDKSRVVGYAGMLLA
jgi:AmmeMemoRadiSam system protein B/AmmeMemoRadiSam system protein A